MTTSATRTGDGAGRAARNLLLLHALADVARRSAAAGVRLLPLKGGALLATGVVAPHQRHLDDIDVWVEPGRARTVYDLLVAAGYRPSSSSSHDGTDSLAAPTHQLPVLRSPFGAIVELHLESHGRGGGGEFDVVYGAGVDVVVEDVVVRAPSPLHQLEQLCGHVVVHHAGEQRYWPRHVDDVRALLVRAPELAALRARPDEVGLSLRVVHGVDVPASGDALLARLLVQPAPAVAAALRAAAVVVRAGRFFVDDPSGFARVVVPSRAHLRFTGDLREGEAVLVAQARRWRRILGRL